MHNISYIGLDVHKATICPKRASTLADFSCATGRSIPAFEPGRKPIAAG